MPITVLIVDDHAVLSAGIASLLESQPDMHVVGSAANGQLAVQRYRDLRPDVVLMDIAMPELNGTAATQRIRELDPVARVVMLSMFCTAEHAFLAFQAGALGFVTKSAPPACVLAAIRAAAADQRYLCPSISDAVVKDYVSRRETDTTPHSPVEGLSAREREVLQLVVEGRSGAEIATRLFLAPSTVDTYRARIMQKLGVKDLTGLIKFAIQHGLTPPT